jgi:hypothetical protein
VTSLQIDEGERRAALVTGARVLREQYPSRTQVAVRVQIGPNTLDAIAMLKWPGFVRITLKHSGEFIAQSAPGKPHELDAAVTV